MKKRILIAAGTFTLAIVGFVVAKGNKKAGITQAFVRTLNFTIIDNSGLHFTTLNNGGTLKTAMFRTSVAGGHNYTLLTQSGSTNKVFYK